MITALLSLSLLLTAAPAVTDPVAGPTSVSVRYHDLNLRSAAGRTELDRRLAHAVRTVCPAPDQRDLRQLQAAEACREVATRAADGQRQLALAAVHADTVQIGSTGRCPFPDAPMDPWRAALRNAARFNARVTSPADSLPRRDHSRFPKRNIVPQAKLGHGQFTVKAGARSGRIRCESLRHWRR